MKAAQYLENSEDPTAVKIREIPKPEPAPGSVVVQIKAAAINPVDAMVLSGVTKGFGWSGPLPFTFGYDFSGVIVAADPADADTGFKVGDSVFAVNWGEHRHDDDSVAPGGAFAEYIKIPLAKLSKKPEGVSFDEAAAVALVGTTAYQVVTACAQVEAGQKVLIFGGSTTVGSIAIQICKAKGAWVATTASKRTTEYVKQYNPDLIVDYTAEKWEENPTLKGLDAALDLVGEADGLEKVKASGTLKPDGRFVTIVAHGIGFDPNAHPPLKFASSYVLRNDPKDQDELAAMIVAGTLKVAIHETFPFTDEGLQAIQMACKSGKAMGKLVMKIAE